MVARLTPPPEKRDSLSSESVFSKVAELGSFRRAALVLGIPAASAAGTVRALERRRGRALLIRAGGALAVSEEGAALLRSLRAEAPVELPGGAAAHCTLDVGVCPSETRLLLQALPHFAARHPDLHVRLYSRHRRPERSLGGGDITLELGDPEAASSGFESLGSYRVVTCASPAYLAERGTPTSIDALSAHRSVPAARDEIGDVGPLRFRDGEATREVVIEHVVAASDVGTQIAAALAGLGITQLPLTREVRGQLAQRRLVPILEAYEPAGVPILLGHGADVPPAFDEFRAWLADLYRSECLALSPRR